MSGFIVIELNTSVLAGGFSRYISGPVSWIRSMLASTAETKYYGSVCHCQSLEVMCNNFHDKERMGWIKS